MEMDIKNRSVAFNLADPHQRKLFDHTKRYTNFSSYVKSLIQRDMEGATTVKIETPQFDKSILEGVI